MARFLTLIALLVCLTWQSFAFAHATVVPPGDGDLAHTLLHWSDEAHHHHDGDIHQDDSDESISHVMSDHMGSSMALPCYTPCLGALSPSEALPTPPQRQVPVPFLDGLLRPPKA